MKKSLVLLALFGLAPVATKVIAVQPETDRATTLVLLGTAGGPGGKIERAGIASLVIVGEKKYLVDAGEGVARQLAHAGLAERDIPIVFTGDTGPSKAVEELAQGADILVSEMVSAEDMGHVPPDVIPHMLEEHLVPHQVGRLAAGAGCRAVSH